MVVVYINSNNSFMSIFWWEWPISSYYKFWMDTWGWASIWPSSFRCWWYFYIFLILTAVLTPICILISWNTPRFLIKEFLLCLLAIEVLLLGVFSILDLIGFYILFEGILIPMFLIIGVWGSREEKVQASYYFFFYTFLGSVFMLLAIFTLYSHAGTTDYQALCSLQIKKIFNILYF